MDSKNKDNVQNTDDSKQPTPVFGTTFEIEILPTTELSGPYDMWRPKLLQESSNPAMAIVASSEPGKYKWIF